MAWGAAGCGVGQGVEQEANQHDDVMQKQRGSKERQRDREG